MLEIIYGPIILGGVGVLIGKHEEIAAAFKRDFIAPFFKPVNKATFANATTPDQLIAAKIINEIARDYDSWKYEEKGSTTSLRNVLSDVRQRNVSISNKEKGIVFSFLYTSHYDEFSNFEVNGVAIDDTNGFEIKSAYEKIKNERKRLDEAAKLAKARMVAEQKKWDLAEQILGKVRIDGALVPAESFCRDCVRHDGKPLKEDGQIIYLCKSCQNKKNKIRSKTPKDPRIIPESPKMSLKCKHGNKRCLDPWCPEDCHC